MGALSVYCNVRTSQTNDILQTENCTTVRVADKVNGPLTFLDYFYQLKTTSIVAELSVHIVNITMLYNQVYAFQENAMPAQTGLAVKCW